MAFSPMRKLSAVSIPTPKTSMPKRMMGHYALGLLHAYKAASQQKVVLISNRQAITRVEYSSGEEHTLMIDSHTHFHPFE